MVIKLNRQAYTELVDKDIEWLGKNTEPCFERGHIIGVLKYSVIHFYGADSLSKADNNSPDNQGQYGDGRK